MNGNGNGKSWIGVALQVVPYLIAAVLAYGMARVDIAVLQTKQFEAERRLDRIEQKLDRVLELVR